MKPYWMLLLLACLLCGCQLIPGLTPQGTATPLPIIDTITPNAVAIKTLPPEPAILSTSTATPAAAPTVTVQPSPSAAPAQPLILVTKDMVDTGVKPEYIIKIHYPEISGAKTPGLQAFNAEAKKQAQDLLAAFQKDFKNAQALPDPNFSSSFAEATYKVTIGEQGILSISYLVGFYYSGAAHPNSYNLGLNFDLIHGKKVELAELFAPGVDYLKSISDYCTTDLKKQNRLEFPEGALPKAENYKNWNITPLGILISFDSYQVGPYAMGPSEVTIPYAVLKPLLKSGNPLAVFIK